MQPAFYFLIPLFVLATLGVLATGIIGMIKGGRFNEKYGNRLMQLRVAFQAAAVLLVGIALLFSNR